MKEQLIINNTEVELLESLNPNITFNIADISSPDKRKSDFSKTITLAGSKTINRLFEYIFNINIDLQTFNPNVKADCLYLVDNEIQIEGYLQLKEVKVLDRNDITYQVVIFGRLGNFVVDLGDKELDDSTMLWGNLDHDYTLANQQTSWTATTGYVYPIVDYGFNTGLVDWWVEELYPAIYAKEYIDRMFSASGYTYTSTFFTSAPFNKLIVPFNGQNFALGSTAINNRIFSANTPIFDTTTTDTIDVPNTSQPYPALLPTNLIRCTNEVYDAGNVYTPSTGVFEAPQNGDYTFQFTTDLQGEFFGDATNDTFCKTLLAGILILVKTDNAGVVTTDLDAINFQITYDQTTVIPANTTVTTQAVPTYPSSEHLEGSTFNDYFASGNSIYRADITTATDKQFNPPNKYILTANNIPMIAGEKVKVRAKFALYSLEGVPFSFINAGHFQDTVTSSNYYTGDVNLKMINATFKNEVVNQTYNEGSLIDMFDAIPKNIKQKDFFMSIVKMFNLYVQTDNQNDKNLFIEPRDDFYNSEVNDWSQKLDVSQALEFLPMGALDSQRYLYTYKADKDYYNELYTTTWNEIYGERLKRVNNDFLDNEYKTEIVFSPTPSVGQSYNDKVIPTIKKLDNNGQEVRTVSNIRILYYGGLKDTVYTWTHQSDLVANQVELQYPYAGHYDDPFTPTVDINFGLTKEIYWDNTFNAITLTDNNLYNKYYSRFIDEITNVNSKIVKGYFYLTPTDIRALSFRELYFFENQYFRLSKVENYNPLNPITKCEFLKLNDVDIFTPTTTTINGGVTAITTQENTPLFASAVSKSTDNNSIGNQKVSVSGEYNYVSRSAQNVEIMGDNNRVFADSRNVTIDGSGNTIVGGLENVTLINTNNQTVVASNVTYVNGELRGSGSIVTISSPTTAEESVTTYLVDTSSGNVLVVLPTDVSVGKVWNVKLIDATNTCTLRCAGRTIDGNATELITRLNTCISVQYDGLNYNII